MAIELARRDAMIKSRTVLPVAARSLARILAVAGAAVAYFARPWSCWLVLGKISPFDAVPYRNFDRHGFGMALDWLLAILFALPTLWLAARVLTPTVGTSCGDHRHVDRTMVFGSLGIALAIGLPSFGQATALLRLPSSLSEPVIVSASLWMATTLGIWALFVRRPDTVDIADATLSRAAALAAFTAAPKLLILGLRGLSAI